MQGDARLTRSVIYRMLRAHVMIRRNYHLFLFLASAALGIDSWPRGATQHVTLFRRKTIEQRVCCGRSS